MNWFKPRPLFGSSLDLDIQSDWDFDEIENAKVWIFAFHFSSCVLVKQYCPVELLAYIEGFNFACYHATGFDTEVNCLRFTNKAQWDSKVTVASDTRNEEYSESEVLLPIVSLFIEERWFCTCLYLEKMQHPIKPFPHYFSILSAVTTETRTSSCPQFLGHGPFYDLTQSQMIHFTTGTITWDFLQLCWHRSPLLNTFL